jgi:NAD(P)H-dependent FMN reductase
MTHIQIILGSTRPNRTGEKVAEWLKDVVSKRDDATFEFIDLRDFPLPFYDEVAPISVLQGKYSTDVATQWVNSLKKADGYIFITPEYNHGYSAVLKNAIDYAYTEWNKKAVGFVSYGSIAGGSRAVEQLRQVAVELQMAPIRDAVHMPIIWEAFDEDGLKNREMYDASANKMIDQTIWWAEALKAARDK